MSLCQLQTLRMYFQASEKRKVLNLNMCKEKEAVLSTDSTYQRNEWTIHKHFLASEHAVKSAA